MILLEWKGYNPTKESALQALYEDQDFADVTLVSENSTSIQVHKVVLSLCSDFFRETLKKNPNPHHLIFLQGVSQEDLQLLKKFMYMGRTEIRTEQIESFMNVSSDGLSDCKSLKLGDRTGRRHIEVLHEPSSCETLASSLSASLCHIYHNCIRLNCASACCQDEFPADVSWKTCNRSVIRFPVCLILCICKHENHFEE